MGQNEIEKEIEVLKQQVGEKGKKRERKKNKQVAEK